MTLTLPPLPLSRFFSYPDDPLARLPKLHTTDDPLSPGLSKLSFRNPFLFHSTRLVRIPTAAAAENRTHKKQTAIRASLVQGRLSQPTQSFLITRVAPLSFASSSSSSGSGSSSSWQVIQERLEGWKGALDRVTATVEKSLAVSGGASSSQGGGARGGGRFGAEELVNHHHHQQAVEA